MMINHNFTIFPNLLSYFKYDNYENIKQDLIDFLYDVKSNDDKRKIKTELSNVGGWQSTNLQEIESFSHYWNYVSQGFSNNLKSKASYAWANINKFGDYNLAHSHPGCDVSGIFWVKCPNGCGRLVFENPNQFGEHYFLNNVDEKTKEKFGYYHRYFLTPSEGSLILFPPHLVHYVEKNESNNEEDRISIAFNLNF